MKLSVKNSHSRMLFLVLAPSLLLLLISLPFKLHTNNLYERQMAALQDPKFVELMTGAGYRSELSTWAGDPIFVSCARQNEKGPLPCDPIPFWPWLEIRLKKS